MQGKEDCKDPTFYTDYGEIRCETVKGKKRFVFYNPTLAESNEMVAFMKIFVANYLPEAQQVATQYLLQRKPAAADAADFQKGGGASGEGEAGDSPQSPPGRSCAVGGGAKRRRALQQDPVRLWR